MPKFLPTFSILYPIKWRLLMNAWDGDASSKFFINFLSIIFLSFANALLDLTDSTLPQLTLNR